jgi:hypothetical protein
MDWEDLGAMLTVEQRADMYLSTLRNYIHAVGGELRMGARIGSR